MIRAESCRSRLESEEGLSFIEFNYMILQAYDFMELSDRHGCQLQMGGSDQWGNIVMGIDLIRRMRSKSAFGLTFPLITTSSGAKMGKTAAGAVWLDPERTSPYEYFQFWINSDDPDVARFLALFTFLPMDEIRAVEQLEGANLNIAKTILAFETTALAHGREAAGQALEAASAMFGKRELPDNILPTSQIPRRIGATQEDAVPQTSLSTGELAEGIPAFKLFHQVGLANSSGAARRLLKGGGGYVNGERIISFDQLITLQVAQDNALVLRAGKKRFHKVILRE
jgi:tyrosyl-tRNA synthetase